MYTLYDWLTGVPDTWAAEPLYPPRGLWVVCGYGRFGKRVTERLLATGNQVQIIEMEPQRTGCPEGCVHGRGTEANTLKEGGIQRADGVVAGTDDDTNNLSIIMTALEINPNLFVIGRQNLRVNQALFDSVGAHIIMQPGIVIARMVRMLLATPMVTEFLQQARKQDKTWANIVVSRIAAVIGDVLPYLWAIKVTQQDACAVANAVSLGRKISIGHLLTDPRQSERKNTCIPLLVIRNEEYILTPNDDLIVQINDRILFCGSRDVAISMEIALQNANIFNYIMTGYTGPDGYIWRWWNWRRSGDRRRAPRTRAAS
jgi:voltage-gated potassium channel